jgi:hypothetical protein
VGETGADTAVRMDRVGLGHRHRHWHRYDTGSNEPNADTQVEDLQMRTHSNESCESSPSLKMTR